ncbi:ABC transporter ATP-binding protein [Sediminibacillus halophilus]|uniref:Putative ABC transport system ATP-binding protein/ATP-binding cassette, subfamily B n=1 Tax=Sediminibacillus halophilus TaxID=482461 RepID=A0A1G9V9K8_9BACI|nr:ABC transporter ATP-binding protein [Sediminibacillus halophilus]SDM68892.1 putative ABC transport system ATP-binding protein/ATP-binding cassette, subfamily B [Sediminibacillus halophilus]
MNFKSMFRAIRFVWERAKLWVICSIIFAIVSGLAPVALVWVMKELINTVAVIIQQESADFSGAFILLSIQFSIMLLSSIMDGLKSFMDDKVQIVLEHDLKALSSRKAMAAPYSFYDIPEFYNHLERVTGSPGAKFLTPLRNLLNIGEAAIKIVSFLVFLFTIHWILVVISVFGAIPIFIVQAIYGRKNFWLMFMQTPAAREINYIEYLMNNKQAAKETRLFGIADYLLGRWSKKYQKNASEKLALIKRQQYAEIGLDSLTALMYAGAALVIIWLIRTTTVKIGEFVAIGQAVQGTQEAIGQISNNLARLYEDSFYIRDYFEFLDFEESRIGHQSGTLPFPAALEKGIRFENVSYRYPNANNDTLDNISFTIKQGEKIAIVGENGSGKTTLVNLLFGLYQPTKGLIFYDGIDMTKISEKELHKNTTVIFQDFIRYSFRASENIAVGKELDQINEQKMKQAARLSGADKFIEEFEEGYDTQLGRFLTQGEELSGGQWQKMAIARALYRDSQVIVLDEPTASLDPISELEIYNQFQQITREKTVLYISHRMSAARFADRILVMENGRIKELGTHEELMQVKGSYYDMYNTQAQWYQTETGLRGSG